MDREAPLTMTIDQIDKVHKAQPFRPFTIHIADGTEHHIGHPELMWRTPGGRTIFVSAGGEDFSIIDLLLVTKISVGNGATRRRRK
jgi:hypothetical protein